MRLARLEKDGVTILACVRGDMYLPVGSLLPGAPQDLGAFLHTTPWPMVRALAESAEHGWLPLGSARILPPLSNASRVFCVGKNYADHAKEMGMTTPGGPVAPDIFVRFPSSFTAHGGACEYPASEPTFDFEGELAVVIGKAGTAIRPLDAWEHVFGLTAANDGSLRRIQKRTSQFTLGKNIDRSGALGPTITPLDAFSTPLALSVRTYVNDRLMQDGNTSDMLFDVPTVIATLSAITRLEAGDIILTGTPAGVGAGRTPPEFLADGDRLRIEIEGLDSLEVSVHATGICPL
jgi:acylpyruvate hydrolase